MYAYLDAFVFAKDGKNQKKKQRKATTFLLILATFPSWHYHIKLLAGFTTILLKISQQQ